MQRYFLLTIKSPVLFDGFRQWLLASDRETGTETNVRVRFVQGEGIYCVLTIIPEDSQYDKRRNECAAFGAIS